MMRQPVGGWKSSGGTNAGEPPLDVAERKRLADVDSGVTRSDWCVDESAPFAALNNLFGFICHVASWLYHLARVRVVCAQSVE